MKKRRSGTRKSIKKKTSGRKIKTAARRETVGKRIEIDILEHELVPKHEILAPNEAEQVLKKLGVKPTQIPWISIDDPVIRAIGAKPGDIIRIIRKSPTAGESFAYRYVVVDTLTPRKKR